MFDPDIVCQLSLSRQELWDKGVDGKSGCYAVFFDGVCLYVGRSRTLLSRILAHRIDQRDGNGVQWRLAGTTEWYFKKAFAPEGSELRVWFEDDYLGLEVELIRELKPTYNLQLYNGKSSIPGQMIKVDVELANGTKRTAVIRGESRDKKCWRLQIDGHSFFTVENYSKSRCRIIEELETT